MCSCYLLVSFVNSRLVYFCGFVLEVRNAFHQEHLLSLSAGSTTLPGLSVGAVIPLKTPLLRDLTANLFVSCLCRRPYLCAAFQNI